MCTTQHYFPSINIYCNVVTAVVSKHFHYFVCFPLPTVATVQSSHYCTTILLYYTRYTGADLIVRSPQTLVLVYSLWTLSYLLYNWARSGQGTSSSWCELIGCYWWSPVDVAGLYKAEHWFRLQAAAGSSLKSYIGSAKGFCLLATVCSHHCHQVLLMMEINGSRSLV